MLDKKEKNDQKDYYHEDIKKKILERISRGSTSEVKSELQDALTGGFIFDNENQKVILEIVEALDENDEYFSQGHHGKIFLIDHPELDKKIIAVKTLRRNTPSIGGTIIQEYGWLDEFYNTLKDSTGIVRTPTPYGVINNGEGENILLMSFVSGMTLFSYKVSKVINFMIDEIGNENLNLGNTFEGHTDKECKNAIRHIIDYLKNNRTEHKKLLEYFEQYLDAERTLGGVYAETKLSQVFDAIDSDHNLSERSEDESELLKDGVAEGIKLLHSKKLYHNDLNTRNIILGEDGYIYFIDFDKSDNKYREGIIKGMRSGDPRYISRYKETPMQGDYKVLRYLDL